MDLKENDILSKDHKNLRNKRIRTIVSFVMIIGKYRKSKGFI